MQQLNDRVYTETTVRGCNPSFVITSAGTVVIDTPQLPTRAVAMRKEVESHGPIQYLINTEHHVDHIFGNYWFRGAGTVVNHKGLYDNFMVVYPELDPFEYAREAIPTDDPDGAALFPDRDEYYADPNKGTLVFTGDLSLRVGGHGPVTDLSYVDKQRSVLLRWKTAVADAVAAGWTKEETQARIKFPDLGPVDVGQEYMLEYVETLNAGSLFDKLTDRQAAPLPPRT